MSDLPVTHTPDGTAQSHEEAPDNQHSPTGCECAPPLWEELLTEGAGIAFAALAIILVLYLIGYVFSLETRVSNDIAQFIAHAFSAVDPKIFWLTGVVGGVAMLTSSELSKLVRKGVCLPLLKFLFHCCALSIGCALGVAILSFAPEYRAHLPTVLSFGALALGLLAETVAGVYVATSGLGAPLKGTPWKVTIALTGLILVVICGFGLRDELRAPLKTPIDVCSSAQPTPKANQV